MTIQSEIKVADDDTENAKGKANVDMNGDENATVIVDDFGNVDANHRTAVVELDANLAAAKEDVVKMRVSGV